MPNFRAITRKQKQVAGVNCTECGVASPPVFVVTDCGLLVMVSVHVIGLYYALFIANDDEVREQHAHISTMLNG